MQILKNNLKSKFLILTLCFIIIFSSINIKKSYADFVISPIMLATVSALAVGTGIALNGADDLYDIGRLFVDYVNNHNSIMWDTVQSAFHSSVAFNQATKQVTVGKDFGSIVKGFFDDTFGVVDNDSNALDSVVIGTKYGYPDLTGRHSSWNLNYDYQLIKSIPGVNIEGVSNGSIISFSNLYTVKKISDYSVEVYNNKGALIRSLSVPSYCAFQTLSIYYTSSASNYWYWGYTYKDNNSGSHYATVSRCSDYAKLTLSNSVSIPYNKGTYNPGNVWGDTEEGIKDVPIYVPGDLSDILNGNPGDIVGDKAPGWVGNGTVSVPVIDNPSIGLDSSTSFPQTEVDNPSIPGTDTGTDTGTGTDINTGIWATIKDFVISLVVPSDTFWTDTWNGLYGSFVSAFPGVDMDNFNSLVTGEKKFPNIDINIMGVKGRVVNGDVINSIVDWLRPIIAGFMMLCLMFFNYRKIYKLIRNSEPFGGIAPGTSDFSTGISEYSDNYLKAKEIIGDNLRVMVTRGDK